MNSPLDFVQTFIALDCRFPRIHQVALLEQLGFNVVRELSGFARGLRLIVHAAILDGELTPTVL
jgi:hypothetical protein